MGRCRGSTRLGNGGVCRWDPLDLGEIHPPRRLAHGSGRRRSRRYTARGRLAGVSRSSRPLRPAELLLSSTASARPDAGTHGRRRLKRELFERSDMAAGRAPAAFSCLRSARHGKHGRRHLASSASSASAQKRRLAELPPCHLLGAPPQARHGDVQQAELSHCGRPSSRRLLPSLGR
jgi:hypothetical protein